jgi:hypothetical protein
MLRVGVLCSAALGFAACGSSNNAPAADPPIAAHPDVIITFDRANHACIVALYSEPNGNTIPCAELIPFLRDELRVPNGAIYDTHVGAANVDEAEVAKITQSLKDTGYRFIGGH